MKKAYSIRVEEKDYKRVTELGGSFPKGLELLLNSYNTNITQVGYNEFKEAFQKFAEVAKKFKPSLPY